MPIASRSNILPDEIEVHGLHQRCRSDSFIDNVTRSDHHDQTGDTNTNNNNGGDDRSYDNRSINRYRRKAGQIAHDERFDAFILILITLNSAIYGVETFPYFKERPDIMSAFDKVDLVILVVFTLELLLNLYYEGKRFVRDGLLIFDFVIVLVSWIAVEVKSLQVIRVFRAFRFLTKVELLRNVVVAVFSVVPAIAAITVLLLLIMYIFSVMCTQLFKNFYTEGYTTTDYFGRLDSTLFTLFQILCMVSPSCHLRAFRQKIIVSLTIRATPLLNLQDEWSGIAYEVSEERFWAWSIFIIYIIMSGFVVVNLIIAVICDALQILRSAERAMLFGLSKDEAGEWPLRADGNYRDDEQHAKDDVIQRQINDMHLMLDEIVASQEKMNRTIQCLSLVVENQEKTVEAKQRRINEMKR